ncbi:MAG: YibE/F family protein [Defluviitaleaceae bacterium]|nr:YibE/F family protein [Defluviitaleaceae bacterium]
MNLKNERKLQLMILAGCFVLFSILLLVANHVRPSEGGQEGLYYERGRVVELVYESTNPYFRYQTLLVEMITGEFQGMTVEAQNNLMNPRLPTFDEGDRVIVELTETSIQISSPDRGISHILFIALFLILLCLIGGKRGFLAVSGLLFSLATILFILVPLTLAGYPSIFVAVIVGILIIVTSITFLAGVNAKSIAAISGCIAGVLIAALFAFIAGRFSFISGYHIERIGFLRLWNPELPISGIFISGVIIAAIGAISDTSMTIASAMEEIKRANPTITRHQLAQAGFNIGRDAMGTMSNTLILAFVGSSFSVILLFTSLDMSWIQFINEDEIGIEIIQGIAGSIGIVSTVPITTFISAKLFSLNNRE